LKKLLFLSLTFLALELHALDAAVSGTVLDAETKLPLPFTNIGVVGQNRGTVSNSEGQFVLDMQGLSPQDQIMFSYVGYETLKIAASELQALGDVHLKPASINLHGVAVYSRSLTAEEIIKMVRKNYDINYPQVASRQRIFLHKYDRTPFPEENQITLKKTDFVGLEKSTFDELFRKLPREFVEYQDALVELYTNADARKVIPLEGVSMEESSMQDLSREMETKLGAFFEDIEKSEKDDDIYYKFRSGVLAIKAGHKNDQTSTERSIWEMNKNDSLHYYVKTGLVTADIGFLLNDYSRLKSTNWEFINSTGKYEYTLGDLTLLNDEPVYEISFSPKNRGLFEGVMYISTATFAVLQLDFAFAAGKTNENIHMLGFGHSMNFKQGRVIYEKGEGGYFVKYIYAKQHETASIERDFTVMKKQKRFLVDKELSEIKLETELQFDMQTAWELLVIDRERIGTEVFEQAKQPFAMKFRKEYAYSPDMWTNSTVIAPTSELKKYKRTGTN